MQKRITMDNTQQAPFELSFTTLLGAPAEVDGAVQWETVNGESTLTNLSEDGKTGKIRSQDGLGITNLRATADADLGEGMVPIVLDIEVTVIGPQAAAVDATFGPFEPKDAAKKGSKK